MNYASFGTVSHGTLQTGDLLDSFASELEYHVQRNAEEWCSDAGRKERDRFMALIGNARETDPEDEFASEIVDELFDALQQFAPPYAYFGAHEGDGSDFGFWLMSDITDCFDGLKVDDTSEVPDDYSGEVLHVSDHGNLTLYSADKGALTEVWAVV